MLLSLRDEAYQAIVRASGPPRNPAYATGVLTGIMIARTIRDGAREIVGNTPEQMPRAAAPLILSHTVGCERSRRKTQDRLWPAWINSTELASAAHGRTLGRASLLRGVIGICSTPAERAVSAKGTLTPLRAVVVISLSSAAVCATRSISVSGPRVRHRDAGQTRRCDHPRSHMAARQRSRRMSGTHGVPALQIPFNPSAAHARYGRLVWVSKMPPSATPDCAQLPELLAQSPRQPR